MSRRSIFLTCICLVMVSASAIIAQGPRVVAIGDRHLWRERVDSADGFDKASRAAIVIYTRKLEEQEALELKSGARPQVIRWLDKELALSRSNYELASKSCTAADWTCVRDITAPAVPKGWKVSTERFASEYIGEQVRLAALFPRTTSEIDLFDANEFNGDRLPDRKFFLTFDDGPTSAGGTTDGVLQMLGENRKTAIFFLLGGNLNGRIRETSAAKVVSAYQGQCVGSHGWEHLSHASTAAWRGGRTWKTSVADTEDLLRSAFAGYPGLLPLFRPPYGQRRADSGPFFQEQALRVALWDIDSQDWNAKMTADDVTNRIETLMLIKRHGILLFHDKFLKAKTAVPTAIHDFAAAVDWGDCHEIREAF